MKRLLPDLELQVTVVPNEAIEGDLRDELLLLCSLAYDEDLSAYFTLLSSATHLLGRLDGQLVSHAAWVERTIRASRAGVMRTAYVEVVATLPEHQGKGYGSRLMTMIPPLVNDFELAALSPTDAQFYGRLGWEQWSGPLACLMPDGEEKLTPDEEVMVYRLPLTPTSLDKGEKLSIEWRPIEIW
jgi:aminoglycoside 2'-N-acetyltransferase I